MKKLVLVDFSNLARACWHPALAAEEAGKKALEEHLKTAHTEEFVEQADLHGADCCADAPKQYDAKLVLHTNLDLKLNSLKEALGVEPNRFIFVEDDHAHEKFRIYPGYKANRRRDDFDPRPLAKSYLQKSLAPKAHFIRSHGHEADDAIATAAVLNSQRLDIEEVIVVSGDRDLWALTQYPKVKVYSSHKRVFVTPEHIAHDFDGLRDPRYISLYKALWGDSGDNIPNVMPRQKRVLIPLFQQCDGTLMDFLEKSDGFDLSDKCQQMLHENLRQVVINDHLARLATNVPIVIEPPRPG